KQQLSGPFELGIALRDKQVYLADGGKLILESPIPAEFKPLRSILWKHNRNMVVEWIEKLGSVEYYGAFQGHTTLDRKTARLEIANLTLIYSGVYSLELNGQIQSEMYKVTVISKYKVPKPMVRVEPLVCSSTSSLCKLSCNGGIPEAEPITYSWRPNTGDWTESSKLMDITKDDKHVENFFCQMKNPLSEEESEPWKNVFYPGIVFPCPVPVCLVPFCQGNHAILVLFATVST
uniref:Ig-like domain-containing protein n=1 Tax=Myripristis murdjan TaxID=586833 RepID=A0A667WRG8_9TELE